MLDATYHAGPPSSSDLTVRVCVPGTNKLKFGHTRTSARSTLRTSSGTNLFFIWIIKSAERPTIHTPVVNSAVRNGVENAENTSATAHSTSTSPIVSTS